MAGRTVAENGFVVLWGRVVLADVLVWVGTMSLREDSNLWPINLVFVMGFAETPLFFGH
jgi:hypothetical protein